jgi:hypothetical protein
MPDSAILVETTILVDFLRRSVAAADYLDAARAQANLICSAVTKAELIAGSMSRGELRAIDQLLDRFETEPIVADDSARALLWLAQVLSLPRGRLSRLFARGSSCSTPHTSGHIERETLQSAARRESNPAVLTGLSLR